MAKKSFSNPVINELKGSAWFKRLPVADKSSNVTRKKAASEDSERKDEEVISKHAERPNDRTVERSNGRTVVRPNDSTKQKSRITKRHSFEIYRDQLDRLLKLKAAALLKGEQFNMSAVVRDSLDKELDRLENE